MTMALAHWYVAGFRFSELSLDQRQQIQQTITEAIRQWIHAFSDLSETTDKRLTQLQFWLNLELKCTGSTRTHFAVVIDLKDQNLAEDAVAAVCDQIANSRTHLSFDTTRVIGRFLSDVFPTTEKDASEQAGFINSVERMLLRVLEQVGKQSVAVDVLKFLVEWLGLDQNDKIAAIRRESLPNFITVLETMLIESSSNDDIHHALSPSRTVLFAVVTGRTHFDDFRKKTKVVRTPVGSAYLVSRKAESTNGEWPPGNGVPCDCECLAFQPDPEFPVSYVRVSIERNASFYDDSRKQRIRFPCSTTCALEDCMLCIGLPDPTRGNEITFCILKAITRLHPLDFEVYGDRSRLVLACHSAVHRTDLNELQRVLSGVGMSQQIPVNDFVTTLGRIELVQEPGNAII